MPDAAGAVQPQHGTVVLQRISLDDLHVLALGRVPAALQGRHPADALPPDFVAQRALALQQAATPGSLAGATYYICENNRVVGSCGFKDAAEDGWVEVGYGVAEHHRRRGAGTQALRALCQLAFDSGLIHEVRACIEPDNLASQALALRLGFVASDLIIESDGSCVVVWRLSASVQRVGTR